MTTYIDTPTGTRMILCIGDNGEILKASGADGQEAETVTESPDDLEGWQPDPNFQVIGGVEEGAKSMPFKKVSMETAQSDATTADTNCYWVKLYGNGWVKVCW
jgi:hypothetical protein